MGWIHTFFNSKPTYYVLRKSNYLIGKIDNSMIYDF